jgi:hypothetical protein
MVEAATPGAFPLIVLVLVLEKRGALARRVCPQRLEGSRFGMYPATLANFVSAGLVLGQNSRGRGTRAKAAPLQALGNGQALVNAPRFASRERGRRRVRERPQALQAAAIQTFSAVSRLHHLSFV